MVQGVASNWKRPFAFYFTRNSVSKDDLIIILCQEIIPTLQAIGLIVKCTVCDRGPTSEAVIKALVKNAPHDEPYFVVNGKKI